DHYTRQMHELSLETSEREVRWLNKLIADEASAESTDLHAEPPTTGDGIEVGNESAVPHSAVSPQKEGDPDHG
ncbi:PadR family transcriptional regulator, partial [Gordonia sp. HY442]|nr:PadR family transcriptional regulator [Gordonia zhenghanii]